MLIETPLGIYKWVENWARIPKTSSGQENGRTHGVAVSKSGDVVVFHQAVPAVVIYDSEGKFKTSWGEFPGAHGLTLIEENGTEFLWLTDQTSKRVVKTTLDGKEVMSIERPDHSRYQEGKYVPTWAAQNPVNGDVWVGDGYGSYLVHHFSPDGKHQQSLDGSAGAGEFKEPHGINFRMGSKGPELFITDRANHRIAVYDGAGTFLRSSMTAHSPCCFDFLGDQVLVPELFTGVKILNADSLELISEFGKNENVNPRPDGKWWPAVAPKGWPNLAGTRHIREGIFNSPHGACFAPNGDVYVVEWIIGGRITKLEKQ